jgi:hypothetical protein
MRLLSDGFDTVDELYTLGSPLGNWLRPSRRRQLFSAAWASLKMSIGRQTGFFRAWLLSGFGVVRLGPVRCPPRKSPKSVGGTITTACAIMALPLPSPRRWLANRFQSPKLRASGRGSGVWFGKPLLRLILIGAGFGFLLWFTGFNRGRDAHYCAPPAQNRTCGIPAYGSHLGCLTVKRCEGQG